MKVEENLSDMKVRLAQQLFEVEDLDVLAEVQAILDGAANQGDWWDQLTPEEQAGLDEADRQLDAGESYTNEEVMAKVKEWIKR
jgi:predicted transcriptional regulator